eukprot:CAMPEP_0171479238 /NCGR_PEP_ID=MMETSP0946-20130122/5282_1 /TAXON_ID=109269 /ORGANISM="Vaucheria litorea, Strain CCMP2940" /LENGTH=512 /DNA_ID=CAMNT_0012010083 /DNA_START=25 /DNA_END=1563 /DNA_ORIENTATION=+
MQTTNLMPSSSSDSGAISSLPTGPSSLLGWSRIEPNLENGGQPAPCQRSLHVAVVYEDKMYVFGGYDGSNRVNDFYEFDIQTRKWSIVPALGTPPSPRDRHTGVVHGTNFYVFAGFDGAQRVNDFFSFNFSESKWSPVSVSSGVAPSSRHSHASVVYSNSMFVFGGYDGSYRNDFHEYNFSKAGWQQVSATGKVPRARYRATCVVHGLCMYLFGGHDGTRHLNDVHVFELEPRVWLTLNTDSIGPIPRDSHVSVIHGRSMYVFGGSTGSAMNDFYELRLDTCKWAPVQSRGQPPNHRFCHVSCVSKDSMFVFGGYDGTNRLNDLLEFKFGSDLMCCDIPPSTLVEDLGNLVNNEIMSDIVFIVEGTPIYAHKILCMRCSFFKNMLTGGMVESRAREVVLDDIRRPIFIALLQYLYTDEVDIALDAAMDLFQAADRFGVDRLKRMCESKMLKSINIDNAAAIFHAADMHDAKSLREKCLNFLLANFDKVTKSQAFEEMGRTNIELVFEILKMR